MNGLGRVCVVVSVATLTLACTERLENAVGCPALCPGQAVDIQTVVIEPVVLDTTVLVPVGPGSEPLMLLAARGDTLDARAVVRYDTLPQRFRPSATDTIRPITRVTSAMVRLRINTSEAKLTQPVTVEAYDVDTTATDTAFSGLVPLFRADRLIGSRTFAIADIKDSLRVPLSDSAVLATLQAGRRLRIGFRIASSASAQLLVFSTGSALSPVFSFRPSADTAVALFLLNPHSTTPESPAELREDLRDYGIVVRAPPAAPATDLNVGGLPARRSYMRFVIPPSILDSATVVRATLLLTQRPNRVIDPTDTMSLTVNLVLAGRAVTDVARAATILADPAITGLDTLRLTPADSGEQAIDIASLVRFWRQVKQEDVAHALVLVGTRENGSPAEARFFSIEAAPALRPRLRISYTRRTPFGLP